jgi:hypothetical protein
MANPNVDIAPTGADRAKVALAVALVIAGVAAFYALAEQPTALRVAMVLAGIAAGVAVAWFSQPASASSASPRSPGPRLAASCGRPARRPRR